MPNTPHRGQCPCTHSIRLHHPPLINVEIAKIIDHFHYQLVTRAQRLSIPRQCPLVYDFGFGQFPLRREEITQKKDCLQRRRVA